MIVCHLIYAVTIREEILPSVWCVYKADKWAIMLSHYQANIQCQSTSTNTVTIIRYIYTNISVTIYEPITLYNIFSIGNSLFLLVWMYYWGFSDFYWKLVDSWEVEDGSQFSPERFYIDRRAFIHIFGRIKLVSCKCIDLWGRSKLLEIDSWARNTVKVII